MVGTSSKIYNSIPFPEGVFCNIHVVYSLVLAVGILQNHFYLLRINLSFVPDCKNPQRYLRRMSGIKGLVSQKKPYDTLLNNKQAVIMKGMCLQGKEPFRRLVVGIPDEAGLYLMEICCPEECYVNHQSRMRSIIGSLRVGV